MDSSIIALFIILFFGVIAALVILGLAFERKRRDDLERLARSMKLSHSREGGVELLNDLSCFQLFSSGQDQKIQNILSGTVSGVELYVFDYRYSSGGSSPTTYHHAVAYIRTSLKLPGFRLRPTTIIHKIGNLFGYQDINFESHPKFSKVFNLTGNDEAGIRELFSPRVLSFCETQPKLNAEGKGEKLIIYRYGTLKPAEVQDLIRTAVQLSELMRS